MFYNTWLINQCWVPTNDHWPLRPLHCRHLSQSLGSHNLIIPRHKHYKDSSRITIFIQTSIEIPTSASQSIVDDPMKVNCSSPLGPSAESPPNYSRSEILTLHPAAGKNAPRLRHGPSLDHRSRSRSIARILRIARIQYGDRNLLGLWHHQTSKHRNISRYTKYWKFLFVWLYLHWAVFVWVCGLVWSLCLCHRVIR